MRQLLLLVAPIAVVAACSSFTAVAPEPSSIADGGVDASPDEGLDSEAPPPDGGRKVRSVITGIGKASGIAVFDGNVYWTEANTGGVQGVSAGGGTPFSVARTGGAPKTLVANEAGLYWCDTKDFGGGEHASVNFRSWDGVQNSLNVGASTDTCVALVALPKGAIGWISGAGTTKTVGYATAGLLGSATASLNGNPFGVAAIGEDLYVTQSASGSVIRFKSFANILSMPAAPDGIASSEEDCQHITAAAAGIFWASPRTGRIGGRDPGGVPTFAWTAETQPRSIIGDDSHVYWRDPNGAIRRVETRTDAKAETFATTGPASFEILHRTIALSNDDVYWLDADGIGTMPKR